MTTPKQVELTTSEISGLPMVTRELILQPDQEPALELTRVFVSWDSTRRREPSQTSAALLWQKKVTKGIGAPFSFNASELFE
jgi:hypothetical protein